MLGGSPELTIAELLVQQGFDPPTDNLKEAEILISDTLDRLYSYKTALKILASENSAMSQTALTKAGLSVQTDQPQETADQIDHKKGVAAPIPGEFESDLFRKWKSWRARIKPKETPHVGLIKQPDFIPGVPDDAGERGPW